ncbi:hypothetical protein JTE90_024419 [Oedothorax gibbosus]|uniref:DUF4352 domain-containing protein n=1 Tax=Oedothorax gibbosus TaxID=931172 RepID=A0AAV6UH49_9ARAC|nr:hypothetical protein JTE90_024419 [Oedothorax gibbosus]
MRSCSTLFSQLLLLLTTAAAGAAPCPTLATALSAPGKALLAPIVFHGRLSGLARRGTAVQQATFKIDKVLKGNLFLKPESGFAVVEFSLRNSSRCRGAPFDEQGLRLGHRYVVFAAKKKRQRMIAVAAPEPYAKRRAVARVLCADCGEWI